MRHICTYTIGPFLGYAHGYIPVIQFFNSTGAFRNVNGANSKGECKLGHAAAYKLIMHTHMAHGKHTLGGKNYRSSRFIFLGTVITEPWVMLTHCSFITVMYSTSSLLL